MHHQSGYVHVLSAHYKLKQQFTLHKSYLFMLKQLHLYARGQTSPNIWRGTCMAMRCASCKFVLSIYGLYMAWMITTLHIVGFVTITPVNTSCNSLVVSISQWVCLTYCKKTGKQNRLVMRSGPDSPPIHPQSNREVESGLRD